MKIKPRESSIAPSGKLKTHLTGRMTRGTSAAAASNVWSSLRESALIVLGAALLLCLVDAILFRTPWYARFRDPNSSTGRLEEVIASELTRQSWGRTVLVLGDSVMGEGFSARLANRSQPGPRYQFVNAAVPGSTARCWYYMLRDMERPLGRYAVVVIPVRYYDDRDISYDDPADWILDAHYLAGRLRLLDVPAFAESYRGAGPRFEAFRKTLLKGLTYQEDFQALIDDPEARLKSVNYARGDPGWHLYYYAGLNQSLAGLAVNWRERTVAFPPGLSDFDQSDLRQSFFAQLPPTSAAEHEYRLNWIGRIVDRYQHTNTRIVIIRPPITALTRPDEPPPAARSAVRELASRPGVTVLDEHAFDALEKPELFADARHWNQEGAARFTAALVRLVAQSAQPAPTGETAGH